MHDPTTSPIPERMSAPSAIPKRTSPPTSIPEGMSPQTTPEHPSPTAEQPSPLPEPPQPVSGSAQPASESAPAPLPPRKRPRYLRRLDQIEQLDPGEREALRPVTERFVFRSNDYYNSLIDWDDTEDPIRRIIIPHTGEMVDTGELDASREEEVTVVPGLQHKYPHTALLLVNDVCGGYCRFCFRKRLFMDTNDEVARDISAGLEYIRSTPAINNVLLTGGDPLLLHTTRLDAILGELRSIPHVRIIRIGSKIPAFNPHRILDDPQLLLVLRRHSQPHRRVYVMAHFNHPRELTTESVESLHRLALAGVTTVNQTPMIRGVNDSGEVLAELFRRLSYLGVPPYYLFQCRPTAGNDPYTVPLVEGYRHFEDAKRKVSGLAKRARYVMSHASGKIEIIGVDRERIYLKYHRARNPRDEGRFMVFARDDRAAWMDDLLRQSVGDGVTPAETIRLSYPRTRLRARDLPEGRRQRRQKPDGAGSDSKPTPEVPIHARTRTHAGTPTPISPPGT